MYLNICIQLALRKDMRGDFVEDEEQKKGIGFTLKIREGES